MSDMWDFVKSVFGENRSKMVVLKNVIFRPVFSGLKIRPKNRSKIRPKKQAENPDF
jgi:hypothetical protein